MGLSCSEYATERSSNTKMSDEVGLIGVQRGPPDYSRLIEQGCKWRDPHRRSSGDVCVAASCVYLRGKFAICSAQRTGHCCSDSVAVPLMHGTARVPSSRGKSQVAAACSHETRRLSVVARWGINIPDGIVGDLHSSHGSQVLTCLAGNYVRVRAEHGLDRYIPGIAPVS